MIRIIFVLNRTSDLFSFPYPDIWPAYPTASGFVHWFVFVASKVHPGLGPLSTTLIVHNVLPVSQRTNRTVGGLFTLWV